MGISDQDLEALAASIEAMPGPEIHSVDELVRHEQVRFAEHFDQQRPAFRTSVKMHFHGPGVRGHNLRGSLAASVIDRFIRAVKVAGTHAANLPDHHTELFLSPTVAPGSAILELYGEPRQEPENERPLTEEIDDAPVDMALESLFETLKLPESVSAEDSRLQSVHGPLGNELFHLARHLIEADVDLGLQWQKPRGSITGIEFDRSRSRLLQDLLNRETKTTVHQIATGTLISISTLGTAIVQVSGRQTKVAAGDVDEEQLRLLWGKDVRVEWEEVTVSHPQRAKDEVNRTLTSIEIAPPEEQTFVTFRR